MVSAAVLLIASLHVGQVNASDGPPRQWLPAVVNGKVVQLWGWRDVSGGVGYRVEENAHIFKPAPPVVPAPVPKKKILSPGQTISADGAINNGLLVNDVRAVKPTGTLETNDPDLARKLESPCPGPGPCPPDGLDQFPDVPLAPDPWAQLEPLLVPAACLVASVLLLVFARRR